MKKVLIFCWLSFLYIMPAGAASYTLSILPSYYPKHLKKMMAPLAAHLSARTGEHIRPVLTTSFKDYQKRIRNGEITIGYQNPLVYVNLSDAHEVLFMAINDISGDTFRGIVIARSDSDINKLADLAGKTIMTEGENSACGSFSQRLSLLRHEVNMSGIKFETAKGNRAENVIIAVSIGDVDAGFIEESAFHLADKYIQPGSIKKVVATAWLPHWALSIDRKAPPELRAAVQQAMLELKEYRWVYRALGIKRMRPARDSQYNAMRTLLETP